MKLISAKCPNCGADINIDADSKVVKCEYCDKSIIVEDNSLNKEKEKCVTEEFEVTNYNKKVAINKYLIICSILFIIANIIGIKICLDNVNSLGFIAFLFSGLLYLLYIKQSGLRKRSFLFAFIVGLIFFIAALSFALYVHNIVPEYAKTWESENIKLIIEKKQATIEFKNTGVKETTTYSANTLNDKTTVKIGDYTFIYSKSDNKMCYSQENECIEELKKVE